MSRSNMLLVLIAALTLNADHTAKAATFFLDDPAVTVSGSLAPAGSNFIVDGKWALADSTAWVWNALQPGHEFLISGTNGSGTNENTAANPATVELNLGNGVYSNVEFLVLSHGFHSTIPPTASVTVVAEGISLGAVTEVFTAAGDIQSGANRYNWVTLPGAHAVTDGKLTLGFGDATSVNPAWYTIGQLRADFTAIPEPATASIMSIAAIGVVACFTRLGRRGRTSAARRKHQ